jgi:hypothetical protein
MVARVFHVWRDKLSSITYSEELIFSMSASLQSTRSTTVCPALGVSPDEAKFRVPNVSETRKKEPSGTAGLLWKQLCARSSPTECSFLSLY